jgi:hypothetical protein
MKYNTHIFTLSMMLLMFTILDIGIKVEAWLENLNLKPPDCE